MDSDSNTVIDACCNQKVVDDVLKKQARSYANKRYYEKNRDAIKAKAYHRHLLAGKIKNPRAATRVFYGDQLDFENLPNTTCRAPPVERYLWSATIGAPPVECEVCHF